MVKFYNFNLIDLFKLNDFLKNFPRYIPYFICLNLYFINCFKDKNEKEQEFGPIQIIFKNTLVFISSTYYW